MTDNLPTPTASPAAGTASAPAELALVPQTRQTPQRPSAWRNAILADLLEIVSDFVQYRELLAELTLRDLRIRYKQAVMGVAWAILTPLVVVFAGWVVRLAFSYMAGAPVAHSELAGVALKSVAWSFFIGALGFSTASIPANLALVTKVYFPRELLPISALLTQVVDTSVGATALLVMLPLLGVHASAALLWVVPLVVLLVLLTMGVTLLTSCANVFFRDAKHLVQLVTSFGIFFTPVFYNAASVGPRGARLLSINPLAPILEGLRVAVVDGHNLLVPIVRANGTVLWSPWSLLYSAAWAIVGTLVAALIFHRTEFKFAEYV